jgi:hypothetical protein
MPLPSKSHYGIEEMAERWGTTSDDILVHAMDGVLELSVMLVGRPIAIGEIIAGEKREEEVKQFNSPLPVYAEDLWNIFKGRASTIGRFKTSEPNRYAEPANQDRRWPVWPSSVVITREERDRFEAMYEVGPSADTRQSSNQTFRHSPDYTSVELPGYSFQLGALQAGIVRELHAASLSGSGWVRGSILLERVRSGSTYLGHLFKSQPNWRELIASDQKGSYRLKMPVGGSEKKLVRRLSLGIGLAPRKLAVVPADEMSAAPQP